MILAKDAEERAVGSDGHDLVAMSSGGVEQVTDEEIRSDLLGEVGERLAIDGLRICVQGRFGPDDELGTLRCGAPRLLRENVEHRSIAFLDRVSALGPTIPRLKCRDAYRGVATRTHGDAHDPPQRAQEEDASAPTPREPQRDECLAAPPIEPRDEQHAERVIHEHDEEIEAERAEHRDGLQKPRLPEERVADEPPRPERAGMSERTSSMATQEMAPKSGQKRYPVRW